MDSSNNSSQGSGNGKPFTKQIAEGARDLLNAGRDIGLLFSVICGVIAFLTALDSPETLAKWVDAITGRNQTAKQSPAPNSKDEPKTEKSYRPTSSLPKPIVIRDTIIKEVPNKINKESASAKVSKEDTVIFKMGNGRSYSFKASRPNGKLELEPIKFDSLLNSPEIDPKINDADLTMVGRYEDSKTSHQQKVSQLPKVWKRHLVKPGHVLKVVAKMYGVTLEALMKANNKKKNHAMRGEWLNIPYPENYSTL